MQITNYDVLIGSAEDESFKLLNDQHVGNRRFEVVLNLHREEYTKALSNCDHDEMERIVSKIVDIVCHKCVPNGRFLEKVDFGISEANDNVEDGDFIDLGGGELARMRLHQALGGRVPATPEVVSSQVEENTERSSVSKRRRRGSYARLRRSISESMLFHSTILQEDITSEDLNVEDPVISNPLDIIFSEDRNSLASTGTPGNARFHILLQMESQRFVEGSLDERLTILDELKTTVQNHWQARFLVATPGSYKELPLNVVSDLITNLLLQGGSNGDSNASLAISDVPSPKPDVARSISMTPSMSRPSKPDTVRQASAPAFVPNAERHRNAAVETLRKKQAKREIMNRMGF
mmetsp:Transcript_2487/g.3664  ORF Transcript_2487/g.3664 Transcript_2487/m.3664 type:complete len:350 (-) Transcript_2487:235-1284(-)|eukprot:CAMPEP_0194221700 /NCGR_PEP_ID=MMETSP0156-20130528/31165_1 /TAXON_ID=33649 /ORGANISM="Thalassionema nitzschioides, Strain L26-B" /LENGTH=349 /DNA_ID=CAMNT_0038952193 /DNA_START=8 /DNA_END=1057 /DNA_ORIENTATION=-